jgi:hypothetical protein
MGETRGYRHHPQLRRFLSQRNPVAGIATYLESVFAEAVARGYHFDGRKIDERRIDYQIPVSNGQLVYEWLHLGEKLQSRNPEHFNTYRKIERPELHPLFKIVEGDREEWERGK